MGIAQGDLDPRDRSGRSGGRGAGDSPRPPGVAGVLFAFWLLLSGHYTPFLVASGAVTSVLIAAIGVSIGYADEEGHPIHMLARGFLYWPWLLMEATKSALAVAWIIVNPRLPIAPRLFWVKSSQKSAVGIVTHANSITITPGTITVEVDRREHALLVHALTQAGADGLATGEMDRRVTVMEGAR